MRTPRERDLPAQTRRLGRVFGAIALTLGGPVAVFSCGHSASAPPPTANGEASAEAANEANAEAAMDAVAFVDAHDGSRTDGTTRDVSISLPDVGADNACLGSLTAPDAEPDGTDFCSFHFPCGLPMGQLTNIGCQVYQADINGAPVSGGQLTCWVDPDAGCEDDVYVPPDAQPISFTCSPCPAPGGRMPEGLVRAGSIRAPSALGAYFAQMAHDEAASIASFARMRDELTCLGAPRSLVDAASRAREDEVRHARGMARRAQNHRATPPRVRVKAKETTARSLEAVARENAIEGCVRETFAAMVATWQATHARDPEVATAFRKIARDETRHAGLAHAFAAWAEAKLDRAARDRVTRAKRRAVTKLRRDVARSIDPALACLAGLPCPDAARKMVDALDASIWKAA